MRPHFIIFISMLTLGQCLTSKFPSLEDNGAIIFDKDGTSDSECCLYGKCHCSNFSLALEHIQDDTRIRIQSNISLHNTVVFGNVSNVTITGDSNPTVRCDHRGGLVGKNINYIVIQGIIWDSCNGITMLSFIDAHIIKCNFLNFIHFALTLHGLGSVNINGSTFSHNNGSIDVLAPSVTICDSKFYADSKTAVLVNAANSNHAMNDVIIENCVFSNISKYCVHCIGSVGSLTKLSILAANFTNNVNTAVNVEQCNITLNSVTFYNNVNVNSGYIDDGGAIRAYNGTVNMAGNVLFYYNRAGNNGGAIYLNHSIMFASQGSILFHKNTAKNGGAIYIGEHSKLYAILHETSLEFLDNNATSNGGAVYVDLHHINDVTTSHQLSNYFYDLLTSTNCTCNFSNTADIGNCIYLNIQPLHLSAVDYKNYSNLTVSSTPCHITPIEYSESTVKVNDIGLFFNNSMNFWLHDLDLSVNISDCSGKPMGPVDASFQCCYDTNTYNCTIDSQMKSFTVTSNDNIIQCPFSESITCNVSVTNNLELSVSVDAIEPCNNIAHAFSIYGKCLPICLAFFSYSQDQCVKQIILPGYWYDNGYTHFVTSCPIGHCNQDFDLLNSMWGTNTFPDQNKQCNNNWGGLACGVCNYSAGYAIKYDTTECVPVDECLTTSITYSLFILFGVSFLYWIVIISFIFVLLHFKLDITAGYAYGLLFYYSVLEQLVNDVTNYVSRNFLNYVYDDYDDYVYDYNDDFFFEGTDDGYNVMRINVLPFLSGIGNLKPPFTGFMNLCFGEAEMIDHLILGYIHPIIVTFLVVIIFILARNFVFVARSIGRYVNSKSICILLLLSYSSITYTSMQLLKPLPVFKQYAYAYGSSVAMQVYWSPAEKYFHGRHLLYGVIAMLCELIIGIGLPVFLIFQRYLIRYCNINFNFSSIKHIIDQLKGCYKEEYRWFAAYYLICRQVLFGVNNLVDYCLGVWGSYMISTPFTKFTIMLTICISIMVIHVWFQPYKRKGLNILDSFILLALVGLLLNALTITYWNRIIGVIYWFLPLLIFINYLASFTKLRYLTVPCSCAGVFATVFLFGSYDSIFSILLLAISFITFIAYIIYVVKKLYTRCCKTRPRYLAIDQNDEANENDDNDVAEVSIHNQLTIRVCSFVLI